MSSLGSTEKHSKHREVPPEVRLVETESVNFGDIVLEIEGNGVVQSQRTLNFCIGSNRRCAVCKK